MGSEIVREVARTVAVMIALRGLGTMKPNILYFLVDNLGMGELSAYSGGPLRGVSTSRIDAFAREGMMLLNFAPEAQCTPSRSALMTGRYSIRSGNQQVDFAGLGGGVVKWERTLGDIFSDAGYATAIFGKWHIGDSVGRWPTDHGFDEWYGIPRSYDECLWPDDPWYDSKRDPVTRVIEGFKEKPVRELEQLTLEMRRGIDAEYIKRAKAFLKRSTDASRPFFLYFNHSLMHLPAIPRPEFKGKTGRGEWADSLLELDSDFGALLDYLKELGAADTTIVVFSGDNGPEEAAPWRGTAGYFEGSYFTGMEGSLRTPALVRYPRHVPAGEKSNEIVHITDMFTTILLWAGLEVPRDRVIDGVDQRAFFEGRQEASNREGFLFWLGSELYGVKWHNFKLVLVKQRTLTDPALRLPNPHLINLDTDPKEREPLDYPYLHSWVGVHVGKIIEDFQQSLKREPLIPVGAPLDFVPKTAIAKGAACD
jgi:arylsulfatase A-like enzyme